MTVRRPTPLAAFAGAVVLVLAAAGGCSSEPERSVANYCTQIETLRTLDEDLAAGDPIRIAARVDDLKLLQQVSPPDVEPSVGVLVGITEEFSRTATTASDRDGVADDVFRRRRGDITAIEAAGTAVQTYTEDNCAIALGPGSSAGPADASSGTGTVGSDPADPAGSGSGSGSGDATTTTSTPSLLVP